MDRITQVIREELTKHEVNQMISNKLSGYLKDRELEGKVKEIVSDCMEKFFKMMYNKRGFWKSDIKS